MDFFILVEVTVHTVTGIQVAAKVVAVLDAVVVEEINSEISIIKSKYVQIFSE